LFINIKKKMRKIRAHYIFDGYKLHKNATLVLDSDSKVIEITTSLEEEAGVEFYNGIVCPGFINAHCHLELSHLKTSIEQHTGLPGFISQVVKRRSEIPFSEQACLEADESMKKNGIVAVGDISNASESYAVKLNSSIYYHTFIEVFDLHSNTAEVYNTAKKQYKETPFKKSKSIVPHAPYSCSKKLIARIAAHSKDHEYPISIHNQEHNSENLLYKNKTGELYENFIKVGVDFSNFASTNKSSLQSYLPLLPKEQHVLLVHNVYTNQSDIDFLKSLRDNNEFTLVLCPLSNLYIGNSLPPLELFITNSLPIAIGTDSLASNTNLSVLDELKCLQNNFAEITLEQLLQAATSNGAHALQVNHTFGSFKAGKKAGVNLLEHVDLQNIKLKDETTVRVLA